MFDLFKIKIEIYFFNTFKLFKIIKIYNVFYYESLNLVIINSIFN